MMSPSGSANSSVTKKIWQLMPKVFVRLEKITDADMKKYPFPKQRQAGQHKNAVPSAISFLL